MKPDEEPVNPDVAEIANSFISVTAYARLNILTAKSVFGVANCNEHNSNSNSNNNNSNSNNNNSAVRRTTEPETQTANVNQMY